MKKENHPEILRVKNMIAISQWINSRLDRAEESVDWKTERKKSTKVKNRKINISSGAISIKCSYGASSSPCS